MKRKYFLRGLGIGICLATLLIMIVYRSQINDAYIVKEAKKMGMEFTSNNEDSSLFNQGQTVSPSAVSGTAATSTTK